MRHLRQTREWVCLNLARVWPILYVSPPWCRRVSVNVWLRNSLPVLPSVNRIKTVKSTYWGPQEVLGGHRTCRRDIAPLVFHCSEPTAATTTNRPGAASRGRLSGDKPAWLPMSHSQLLMPASLFKYISGEVFWFHVVVLRWRDDLTPSEQEGDDHGVQPTEPPSTLKTTSAIKSKAIDRGCRQEDATTDRFRSTAASAYGSDIRLWVTIHHMSLVSLNTLFMDFNTYTHFILICTTVCIYHCVWEQSLQQVSKNIEIHKEILVTSCTFTLVSITKHTLHCP